MALPSLLTETAGLDPTHVQAAEALVRAYCGWHVAPVAEETLTVDGSGASRLILPTLRIVELLTLEVDGVPVVDPQWSVSGVLWGTFPDRPRNVRVAMRHGYDEAPAEVVSIVIGLARRAAVDAPIGVRSRTLGDYSVTYTSDVAGGAGGLSAAHAAVLARYRLPSLP